MIVKVWIQLINLKQNEEIIYSAGLANANVNVCIKQFTIISNCNFFYCLAEDFESFCITGPTLAHRCWVCQVCGTDSEAQGWAKGYLESSQVLPELNQPIGQRRFTFGIDLFPKQNLVI